MAEAAALKFAAAELVDDQVAAHQAARICKGLMNCDRIFRQWVRTQPAGASNFAPVAAKSWLLPGCDSSLPGSPVYSSKSCR
jgi:hypothetical protein